MDASAWIDLVLQRSKELRSAGILAIEVGGGYSATLAPGAFEMPPGDPVKADPIPPDALHDPASYADGFVPGFDIKPLKED